MSRSLPGRVSLAGILGELLAHASLQKTGLLIPESNEELFGVNGALVNLELTAVVVCCAGSELPQSRDLLLE